MYTLSPISGLISQHPPPPEKYSYEIKTLETALFYIGTVCSFLVKCVPSKSL
jgi:hypothetical protein